MNYLIKLNNSLGTFYLSDGSFKDMLNIQIKSAKLFDTIESARSKIAELGLTDAVVCDEKGSPIPELKAKK